MENFIFCTVIYENPNQAKRLKRLMQPKRKREHLQANIADSKALEVNITA